MNRFQLMTILRVILLLMPHLLQAQDVDTIQAMRLQDIWKVAESNNRQLKVSDLRVQESHLDILEARDRLLPELAFIGDVKFNSKFLIYDNGIFSSPQDVPIKGYGYGIGYNLNFNLFNGGADRRYIEIKQLEKTQRYDELELQKRSVKYNVAVAYFDMYKYLHFHDFLTSEIAAEKKQLLRIESLHKNGVVLRIDVLRISVKLSELELSLSGIEKKIEITKNRLNILMGRDSEHVLLINHRTDLTIDLLKNDVYADYIATALKQSTELKIADNTIKLSELNVKQIRAKLLPKVSMYSNYNYTYPQISFYPYSNNIWGFGQIGIKVQYAMDNLFKSKHAIARAQTITNQAKEHAGIKRDDL